MRIPVRTSRLAIAARRLASFALPLIIIPVFLHRNGTLDSETFSLLEIIGMCLAAAGFIVGWIAIVRLWFTGDRGWGRAVSGILMGIICLAPVAYAWQASLRYPALSDLNTGQPGIIELTQKADLPPADTVDRAQILAAFPNLISRDYVLTANQAYRMVEKLVIERGWTIVRADQPQLERAQGQINAIEHTLLGWKDEVGIRVLGTPLGVQVTMRSASLYDVGHDQGRNGLRIESFLRDLDDQVTDELRRGISTEAKPAPVSPNAR